MLGLMQLLWPTVFLGLAIQGQCAPARSEGRALLQSRTPRSRRYRCFGDNDKASHAHTTEAWLPFEEMRVINREPLLESNGADIYITHWVEGAVVQVANETGIDPRMILAVMMQESGGNVAAACRVEPVRCGLIHSPPPGLGLGFDSHHPQESIVQMVREGVHATSYAIAGQNPSVYARFLYGAICDDSHPSRRPGDEPDNAQYSLANLANGPSTACSRMARFENDIMNRLLGWDGRGLGYDSCD